MTSPENSQLKEELSENISVLFLKYGLRSTSMDDICSHLKISKKTLYQYFTNKDDVVEQVMLHRRQNYRTRKDLEKLKKYNAVEVFWLIKQQIVSDLNSRMPANFFDLKKYHPDVYERINEVDRKFINQLLHELLARGIEEGFFRKNTETEVQIYLFTKQMSLLSEPEMISDIKYPVSTIVSTIVENVIRSLATPGGLLELEKLINNQQNEQEKEKEKNTI